MGEVVANPLPPCYFLPREFLQCNEPVSGLNHNLHPSTEHNLNLNFLAGSPRQPVLLGSAGPRLPEVRGPAVGGRGQDQGLLQVHNPNELQSIV